MEVRVIFVELAGASGASYRFQAWPPAGRTAMAGNFAVVEAGPDGIRILLLGVTNDLSRAPQYVQSAGLAGKSLFVRLNVAGQTRRQEHEDIAARYVPAKVVTGD